MVLQDPGSCIVTASGTLTIAYRAYTAQSICQKSGPRIKNNKDTYIIKSDHPVLKGPWCWHAKKTALQLYRLFSFDAKAHIHSITRIGGLAGGCNGWPKQETLMCFHSGNKKQWWLFGFNFQLCWFMLQLFLTSRIQSICNFQMFNLNLFTFRVFGCFWGIYPRVGLRETLQSCHLQW